MTHDYPEIQPSEIRKGDHIRWESAVPSARFPRAIEYDAASDGHRRGDPGTHYLIDRSTPPVDLPTEPTLGWIFVAPNVGDLDFWRYRGPEDRAGEGVWAGNDPCVKPRGYRLKYIAAFVPATAVPTEALDELRRAEAETYRSDEPVRRRNAMRKDAIANFLAAVDEANEVQP